LEHVGSGCSAVLWFCYSGERGGGREERKKRGKGGRFVGFIIKKKRKRKKRTKVQINLIRKIKDLRRAPGAERSSFERGRCVGGTLISPVFHILPRAHLAFTEIKVFFMMLEINELKVNGGRLGLVNEALGRGRKVESHSPPHGAGDGKWRRHADRLHSLLHRWSR
jgi:hypothetical protein